MSCKSCTGECNKVNKIEDPDFVVSHTDKVTLDIFRNDNDEKQVTVSFEDESCYIKYNDMFINDVNKITVEEKFLNIFSSGDSDPILIISCVDKTLHVFETEDDEILLINLTDTNAGSKEDYPLFNINLTERFNDSDEKMYKCSIDMITLPGNVPTTIYDLSGNVSEELLYKAKYVVYELELLKDLLRDIDDETVKYLYYTGDLYEIIENSYSAIKVENIENNEERHIPYMYIARMSGLNFLDKNSIYYNGKEIIRDMGRDLVKTEPEKDVDSVIKSVSDYLTLCNEVIENIKSDLPTDISVPDIQTEFAKVESELRDIGLDKENVTKLVLISLGKDWNSISIEDLENILVSTTQIIEENDK